MSTTQIKRLFQSKTEFVPITLAEAVVVNTSNIPGLSSLGITTLDKVLRTTMGVVGTNAGDIAVLKNTVQQINTALEGKQDKLTAGVGITISPEGVISTTNSIELYKIVTQLPTASEDCLNSIYLVPAPSGTAGNIFIEYICVYKNTQAKYIWEKIGEVQTDVDLSGYVTNETFNQTINIINGQLANTITAQDVTTSDGASKVVVNYTIPSDLYDSMVNTDSTDQVIGG